MVQSEKRKVKNIFGSSAVWVYGNMITNKVGILFQVRHSLTVLNLIRHPELDSSS